MLAQDYRPPALDVHLTHQSGRPVWKDTLATAADPMREWEPGVKREPPPYDLDGRLAAMQVFVMSNSGIAYALIMRAAEILYCQTLYLRMR